jgi:hypothetical protein
MGMEETGIVAIAGEKFAMKDAKIVHHKGHKGFFYNE